MSGCPAYSVATISIMVFPRTIGPWRHFGINFSRHGTGSFSGGVSVRGGRCNGAEGSRSASRFPVLVSFIPGPRRALLARRQEVGALCGKPARRALSGGRLERGVPTGTFSARGTPGPTRKRAREHHRKPDLFADASAACHSRRSGFLLRVSAGLQGGA
jgi:hypothetical protein